MRPARVAFFGLLVVVALVVQVSVLDFIPLPDAKPDLLLLVVVAAALSGGCGTGALVGFWVGLLADVAPPAEHAIGRLALVFAVVGYACGFFTDAERRSVLQPVLIVAAAAALAGACYAGLGALTGDLGVTAARLARTIPLSVLYDVLLTPFVLPALTWLSRRLEPPRASPLP